MEFLYKFCYSLTALFGVFQGVFVLCRNPRSRVNVTWALTNFSVAFWALGCTLYFFEEDYHKALLISRLASYAVVFIPVFFTHFCLALLNKPLRESWPALAGYAFAIGMGAFFLTPSFIPSVSPKLVFPAYLDPGPLYVIHTTQFFALVVYSHWLVLRNLRHQPLKRQRQLRYIIGATITGYVFGSTAYLPVYGIPFNPIPSLFTFVYAAIITYAIVRHQILDIKVVITRTGVLLATYLVVLGVPFAVGWWGREWLEQQFAEQWWLVPLGLCTLLATVGPFVYAYLRRQAEARLLKEQRRYQRMLQHAARGMTQMRQLDRLIRLVVRVVSRAVRVEHASLFLWDKESHSYALGASRGPYRLAPQSRYAMEEAHSLIRWLVEHRRVLSADELPPSSPIGQALGGLSASLIVPGLIEHEVIGFLALGKKLSGEAYSPEDLHAFSTLANEAAIAVENARSYEELLKANEQLRTTYDRMMQQERLVAAGQFATGLAHEIKNPLSAIKTFAAYLPEKYKDATFREKFFRIVQSEIDRINTIVRQLSDFAKPAPLKLQSVRVSEILQDTLSLLSNQCLKQGVEITPSFHEDGLAIQADPQQLKQVFLNLFLNSLDAMASGGTLQVQTQVRDHHLIVHVKDTGCGIPSELHDKLGHPFFTTKERGMGLGLAIVKGIIDRHGGRLAIRSQEGKGTAVEVSLPVVAQGVLRSSSCENQPPVSPSRMAVSS